MNIAIVGYGKMGKIIEKSLIEKKMDLISTIDNFTDESMFKELNSDSLKRCDTAIEFANAEGIMERVNIYVENKINVVMGTTGWYDKIEEIKKIVDDRIGFIWSGNYSLGVNIFFRIVRQSAKIFNKFIEYEPIMYELHHKQKKDSPSGTSKMISKILNEELASKSKVVEEKLDRKIEDNEIHSASIRGGYIPGIHTVLFDSPDDTVELKHSARSREGMARGALMAVQWIKGKKGFFTIDDFMNDVI
ncbi:MAG: 4-hydroxy-tetrahydrodipicolinate reductase [Spirochaetes bacterium]|nr:4-hydroxy-tetrahydrodipicolinate reductase [Spirochaetota bacterium]